MGNKVNKFLVVFLVFTGFLFNANAQSYFGIDGGGTQTLCSDSLTDSGLEVAGYGSNDVHVITICPDEAEGSKVQLMFAAGIDIHATDTLYIYDGTDPSVDPLLMKINNDVNNLGVETAINSTFENNSGCLTVVFVSDGADEGAGWVAGVNCYRPCQQVFPNIISTDEVSIPNDNTGYVDLCLGDTVAFEATGIYPQSDIGSPWHSQSNESTLFTWYFGDGSSVEGLNLTSVEHAYSFAVNGFIVKLKMQDSLGCNSSTIATRKVRVSTVPSFADLSVVNDTICYGESVDVIGGADATEGGFILGGILDEFTPLPDEVGVIYETNILIDAFNPGQTITNITDIQQVCIKMEHSYTGDLEMVVKCPNGQSATLVGNPNSGGGTFVGEPVDFETTSAEEGTVGVTYMYCFSMNADYGTWSDEAGNYQQTFTDALGNEQTNADYYPAGSYTPDESFTSLIGCPLNGTWTIEVIDNLGADNGYIDGWGAFFDPSLDPSAETYIPIFDELNYQWSADVVTVTGGTATIEPSAGEWENEYSFSVTDDFGCTYDTTFTIYTYMLNAQIFGDTNVCEGNSNFLSVYESGCEYTLNLFDNYGDGWNDSQLDVFVDGISQGIYTVEDQGLFGELISVTVPFTVDNGSTIELRYTDGTTFDSEVFIQLLNGDGFEVYYEEGFTGNSVVYTEVSNCIPEDLSYAWYPSDLVNDTTLFGVLISPVVDATYNVIVQDTILGCSDTSSVNLYIVPNFGYTVTPQDARICQGESVTLSSSVEAGGTYTYEWFPSNLFINNTGSSVTPLSTAGNHVIVAAITSNFGCTNYGTLPLAISPNSAPVVDIFADPGKLCVADPDSARLYVVVTDTTTRGCTYTLDMYDDIDFWNGGSIDVIINGSRIGNFSATSTNTLEEIVVQNADTIELNYISGGDNGWESENSFCFYDSEGTELICDGPPIAVGNIYNGIASCPSTISTFYEYEWVTAATLSSNNSDSAQAKPTANTLYYVTATDGIGGCIGFGSYEVTVTDVVFDPTITADDFYCDSQAPSDLEVADPVGYWQGTGITNTSTGTFDPAIAGSGEHQIDYIIDGGCGATSSITITVLDAGSVSFTDPGAYCASGGKDTLVVFPSGGTWTGQGISDPINGVFDPAIAFAGASTLTYELQKCGTVGNLAILVNSNFDADFDAVSDVCDGGVKDTLYFTSSVEQGGVWSGDGIIDANTGGFDPSLKDGINIIKYEFLTGCMDFDIDTIYVGIQRDATIDSIGEVCKGNAAIQLTAAEPNGVWSGDGIINSSGEFAAAAGVIGYNDVYYTISGGCGDKDTARIVVSGGPSISSNITDESCELAGDGIIEVIALGGIEPYTYNWSNGDSVAVINVLVPGVYDVTIADATGCNVVSSAEVLGSLELCETPAIFVGNIFSPNGDGSNDVLTIMGVNVSTVDFIIYNRWGEKVYETTELGTGWDGYFKGKLAPTGVYVYYLKAVLRNGQEDIQNGNVTLVR